MCCFALGACRRGRITCEGLLGWGGVLSLVFSDGRRRARGRNGNLDRRFGYNSGRRVVVGFVAIRGFESGFAVGFARGHLLARTRLAGAVGEHVGDARVVDVDVFGRGAARGDLPGRGRGQGRGVGGEIGRGGHRGYGIPQAVPLQEPR